MSALTRTKRPPVIWFPLLRKELTEKANRLRTYWIRTGYALAFFCYFGFEGYGLLKGAATGLAGLGTGAAFFEKIYLFQLIGTLLFLPALMSGLITQEKERSSLPLLLTTDLAPWRIILQKYIGGLMPMLALQLTAVPMTAVAYSLGGVENRDLWIGAGLIFAHTLNMGAFYLACSTYCGNSVTAFLCAYLLGAIWFALLIPLTSPAALLRFPLPPDPTTQAHQWLLLKVLPGLALGLLLLSTFWLRSRAEVNRKNRLRSFFLFLDRAFKRVNDKLGNINVAKKAHSLPESQPIRWRELHQRSLAKPQYLVRIGLVVEVVAVAVILWVASEASPWGSSNVSELSLLFYALWALYALVLTVQGANIIASERTQQTLAVLLTTPLTGSAIIRQKSVVFVRIAAMAIIPLGTVCWTEASMERMAQSNAIWYGAFSLLSFVVISPFVFWLAVTIGLHVRSRFKALLTSMIVILALIALIAVPKITKSNSLVVVLYNPAVSIIYNEQVENTIFDRLDLPSLLHGLKPRKAAIAAYRDTRGFPWEAWENLPNSPANYLTSREIIVTNLLTFALLAFALRFYCLRRADKLLGRAN